MCDDCGNKPSDDIKRAIYYGILKKVLRIKPLKAIEKTIDSAVDTTLGVSGSEASDNKLVPMKAGIYAIASYFYENYLYKMMPKSEDKIMGMCPCEVYRDLYLLFIQQIYNALMIGVNVQNLVTDTISIFGSSRMQGLLEMVPGSKAASSIIDRNIPY